MISCAKCGFENNELSGRCKNCNAILASPLLEIEATPLSKTIKSKRIKEGFEAVKPKTFSCTECNYPMVVQNSNCPNCGIDQQKKKAKKVITEPVNNPVLPQIKNATLLKKPRARLSPLNFKAEPVSIYGTKAIVKKNAIDTDDKLISEHGAFNIEFKSGKWQIDIQDFDTPIFIKLKGKSVIQDGDIIALGNDKIMEFRITKTES